MPQIALENLSPPVSPLVLYIYDAISEYVGLTEERAFWVMGISGSILAVVACFSVYDFYEERRLKKEEQDQKVHLLAARVARAERRRRAPEFHSRWLLFLALAKWGAARRLRMERFAAAEKFHTKWALRRTVTQWKAHFEVAAINKAAAHAEIEDQVRLVDEIEAAAKAKSMEKVAKKGLGQEQNSAKKGKGKKGKARGSRV